MTHPTLLAVLLQPAEIQVDYMIYESQKME